MIRKLLLFACLVWSAAFAQHTFSIVAVDTVTGEVGSAGASCVTGFGVRIIADLHPGVGAINTQAWWQNANKSYASSLMNSGHSPQQIIDSLRANDKGTDGRDSTFRQFGVADLFGTGARAAAHTGSNTNDWKGHIVGPNYSIQGNILLGQQILDSMEARFLSTPGELAVKLMAALQGANVPGADTRCLAAGTSSTSAYIMVAKPGDTTGSFYLDLGVNPLASGREPVDSLQSLFNGWLIARPDAQLMAKDYLVFPNPATDLLSFQPHANGEPRYFSIAIHDIHGKAIVQTEERFVQQLNVDVSGYPGGIYMYEVKEKGERVQTGKVLVK